MISPEMKVDAHTVTKYLTIYAWRRHICIKFFICFAVAVVCNNGILNCYFAFMVRKILPACSAAFCHLKFV